jgi:hypothetical protein
MLRELIIMAVRAGGAVAVPAALSGPASAQENARIAATWDSSGTLRVYDQGAVAVGVTTQTAQTPTDNTRCDLYTSTVSIVWNAVKGHRFTAIAVSDDDFEIGWGRWTPLPG